jgi:hypothetical protein
VPQKGPVDSSTSQTSRCHYMHSSVAGALSSCVRMLAGRASSSEHCPSLTRPSPSSPPAHHLPSTLMSSPSTQSFVATLVYYGTCPSSLPSKHLKFVKSASIPKRADFVAPDSLISPLSTLVDSSASVGPVDLAAFALALRVADVKSPGMSSPLPTLSPASTLSTRWTRERNFVHMIAFEPALTVSLISYP